MISTYTITMCNTESMILVALHLQPEQQFEQITHFYFFKFYDDFVVLTPMKSCHNDLMTSYIVPLMCTEPSLVVSLTLLKLLNSAES